MQGQSVSSIVNFDTQLLKLYTIHKKISNGSFGTVFQVTNKQTNIKSALKVQLIQPKMKPTLKKEIEIMRILQNVEGVPKMYNHGKTDKLYYLQLQLLDRDLSVMVTKNIVTSLSYLCELTIKMINILENVHQKGIIHRDLKPQNIMLQGDCIYLIDYGISEIIPSKQVKKRAFVGTPRYASIAAHKGYSQTPADEIESLMYIIIFIFKRTLPWMDINKKQNKVESIMEIKLSITKQQLCKGLPNCFYQTFLYLTESDNRFQIDYNMIRQNFVRYLQSNLGYNLNNIKGISMSIPHPDTQTREFPERRRFSQMDPQVLGLLLKQRELKNGGKRQSIQTNFLTVPESQHQIKTSSVVTVQLVTTQKAVASESKEEEKENSNKQLKQKQISQKKEKHQDKATIVMEGQIDEHKSEESDIDMKIKSYCMNKGTRGSMRSSTIKLFQFD